MKNLILILLILLPVISFAQDYKFYEGKIYFKNGEVKEGLVRLPVSAKYLKSYGNSLQYKEDEDSKKERFRKGKEIEKVIVKINGKNCLYKYIPVKKNKYKIFQVVNENISPSLYGRQMHGGLPGGGFVFYGEMSEYYIYSPDFKKALPLLKYARSFRYFRKRIKKYYPDCKDLISRMKENKDDYDFENIPEIVEEASYCY